ncbi:UNVERIFIED_CONTAM: hypothetical protein GTU68_012628 [Idotea baltica]|nr:hypothetical protein [Idotea baltica]
MSAPSLTGSQGPVDLKGRWAKDHFNNDNPITLELACGKGEYTLGLAERYPDRNFIGVDIKGARIWKGAKAALERNMSNVAFLRTRIEQITHFFAAGEVDSIWITFADPFLGKPNRRLTSPYFLSAYRKIMQPEAILHLKTDDSTLYESSLEVLTADPSAQIVYQNNDIYSGPLYTPELEIKTFYEQQHLKSGRLIKYVRFTLK